MLNLSIWLPVFAFWCYQSFYLVKPDQLLFFYRLGAYHRTVVSSTYYAEQQEQIANKGNTDRVDVGANFFGIEFAFGPWPFVLGYRLTSTQFEVPVHASQMYTDPNHPTLPRIRMEGDGTFQFRLSVNPIYLGMNFPLFDQSLSSIMRKSMRDLTQMTCLRDRGVSLSGEEVSHEHRVQRVALIFHSVINKPVQEAMRVVATRFTFSTQGGERDIVQNSRSFERRVKRFVVRQPGSVFRQGHLYDENANEAESLLVGDMIVENIQPQAARPTDSPAILAIDRAFIGMQEAKAQQAMERLTRAGQAEGIRNVADTLNLTDLQAAYLLDVLRQSGKEVNLTQLGLSENAVEALTRVIQSTRGGTP
jgi:hypothetical protein